MHGIEPRFDRAKFEAGYGEVRRSNEIDVTRLLRDREGGWGNALGCVLAECSLLDVMIMR